jgi:hypothetical protein
LRKQNIGNGLKSAGFSPEIRDLEYFQDDYGLKPIDGEEQEGDDDEEEDEEDDDDDDDIGGSEGYEIVEDHGDDDDLEE